MNEYIVMAKPVGSRCNMACRYCYYLGKGQYSMHDVQTVMSRPVLEKMIRQLIKSSPGPTVSIVWHGGEPTLAGLDFYKEAVAIEKKYLPRGWQIWNNLQTNAMLIDEAWCDFLQREHWDVGVSIDGTKTAHDALRRGSEASTWEKTAANIRMLRDAGVAVDLLCTVNSETVKDPEGVYDALKAFDTGWMQFIPIVVRRQSSSASGMKHSAGMAVTDTAAEGAETADGQSSPLTPESVTPRQYGEFLCRVFDRWRECGDVGKVHVQLFEETARAWRGLTPNVCYMQETCGRALIVEEDGAVYSCDHFVDDEHRLGNLRSTDLGELANSLVQTAFGLHKRDALCGECRQCEWLPACGGGCPKDWVGTDGGAPKYFLCEGLKMFYEHARAAMRT